MAKPKPSTPPGTNSFGRTYEEQTAWEKEQKAKIMRKEANKDILDKIFTKKTPLRKGETFKVMKGSPNMAERLKVSDKANIKNAKRLALKMKMGK